MSYLCFINLAYFSAEFMSMLNADTAGGAFNYRVKGTRVYLHIQLGFLYFIATFKGHSSDREDPSMQALVRQYNRTINQLLPVSLRFCCTSV